MAKEYKLDLFKQTLPALFNGNLTFYENLTDEEKKEISPRILMRWLSSAEPVNSVLLDFLNTNVNRNVDLLSSHPELQWKLLATVASEFKGKSRSNPKVTWIKLPKNKAKSKTPTLDSLILDKFPLLNTSELNLYRSRITPDDIETIIRDYGLSDKEAKVIKDEIKNQ